MNQGVYEREQVWQTRQKEQAKERTRVREILVGTAAILVLVAFLFGRYTGSAPVGPLTTQNAALAAQVTGLSQTVTAYKLQQIQCRPYDDVAAQVRPLVAHGNFQEAAVLAEMYLGSTKHPACPGSALIPLWYTASLDAIYATPVGSPLDQTPVLRWRSIQQKAQRFGLGQGDEASPLTVFTYAYANQIWSLAKATFITAFTAQLVSVDDQVMLAKYYAVLRNMGHILGFHFSGPARQRGLVALATANAIAQHLQRGEAAADLTALLGSNSRTWPRPDRTDPILAALSR